jgi:hypothetical protein
MPSSLIYPGVCRSGVRTPVTRKAAVVVGIDNYPGTLNDLPSCVADARFVAGLLRGMFGFADVIELHDESATLEAVSRALGLMLAGATLHDRLVFYFSGHGTQTVRHDELRESLCLHDRLFNDDILVDATQQLPPGVLTVVLDSCFSGGMSKDTARMAKVKARLLVEKALLSPLRYRAFGAGARQNFGPVIAAKSHLVAEKLVEETGPTINGLLISACLENETAAASTDDTGGLSAFTFALQRALVELGAGVSVEVLMTRIVEILRSIHIVQSPQLHPPVTPAMQRAPLFLANECDECARFGSDDDLLEQVMRLSAQAVSSVMR